MSLLTFGQSWNNLPREILCEIFMKVGLEDIEDLVECLQVCKNWNEMICNLTKAQLNCLRSNAAEKIREKSRTNETFIPSWRELSFATKLHHLGHLEKEIIEDFEERIVFDKELEAVDASINLPFEEFENILEKSECQPGLGRGE